MELGVQEYLPVDPEEQPLDLYCYCDRCQFKRHNSERLFTNLLYGFLLFPFWCWNLGLYIYSWTLSDQYVFSETIQWSHRDDITLQQDLDDDSTVVGAVIKEHELTNSEFDAVVGWTISGVLLEALLGWLLYVIMV